MRICIYEDSGAVWLEPLTLTRPAFALWCGAERLFERLSRQFAATELGFWIRPGLTELWKLDQPHHPANDGDWLREHDVHEVDVVGIATDYCVRATALDAARAGFATQVLLGLTAGVSAVTTGEALDALRAAGVGLTGSPAGAGS